MFDLKMGDDLSALSDVINSFKNSQTVWNAWKVHIRLETISIDIDADDVSLNQLKKLYKTMKDLGQVVGGLLADIEEESQLLKMKFMPAVRKRGINSLPDEILQMILTEDVRSADLSRAQYLQLTCKRFNAIINSSADCWSRVTNCQRLDKKEISQLDIRKTSPIDLCVVSHDYNRSFRNVIIGNMDRVRSLVCRTETYGLDLLREYSKRSNDLPALKSLEVRSINRFPNWSFSHLLSLDSNAIPSPGAFPLLQHWSLQYANWSFDGSKNGIAKYIPFSSDEILDFLDSTPYMKSLRLSLDNEELIRMSGSSSVTLASLESLTINYQKILRNSGLNRFMERLKLPQVERVIFSADALNGFNLFFGVNIVLPTVKSFEYRNTPEYHQEEQREDSFYLRSYVKEHEDLTLLQSYEEIHHVFPNLERLDIRTHGYLFWCNPNGTYWKSLRTVTFWHDTDQWKANIAGLVANKDFASRLKHLRIYGLPFKDEVKTCRVDVSVWKVLASVYDEAVLEVQSGIMATELDSENLLRFRSEVGDNDMVRK